MVNCKKCGHENELGRIFCYQCGEKLDLETIKPPNQAEGFWKKIHHRERKRQGRTLPQQAWRWGKVLIFLALVLILILIFSPPEMKTITKSTDAEVNARAKMKNLREAVGSGRFETVQLNEQEIWTLIPRMEAEKGERGFGSYQATSRQLELDGNEVKSVIVGDIAFGNVLSLPVVVSLSGELSLYNGTVVFDETGLKVGRLPIPRFLFFAFRFLMNRAENFWSDDELKTHRELVGRARSLRVQNGVVVIETGPSVSPTPQKRP